MGSPPPRPRQNEPSNIERGERGTGQGGEAGRARPALRRKELMTHNAPNTERDFTPAEIVRIHEANCQIDFASAAEQNFRLAMMKYIGRRLGLAELRTLGITGPAADGPRARATRSAEGR
jgi:hypothetical protein